jgi:hypothetical protein
VNPRDQQVRDLKRDLNRERLDNRQLRSQQRYDSYYSRPQPCCYTGYHDPFNNVFFWMWLMGQPSHDRDRWVYNHRDNLDARRYAELQREDADLERRMQALEAQGTKRDASYVPPGLDRDLMYDDEHIKAVQEQQEGDGFPWGTTILIVFGVVAVIGVVYLVFFVRFGARREE